MIEKKLNSYFVQYQQQYPQTRLYGIFDGTKAPMLWSDLEDGVLLYDSLFREVELKVALEKGAPYLVALDFEDEAQKEQSQALLLSMYGKNGAIFMATSLPFGALLTKMQDLFYVYNSEGEVGYLRFFWATVFESIISQQKEETLFNFFYEMEGYWIENPLDMEEMYYYTIQNNTLQREKIINLEQC